MNRISVRCRIMASLLVALGLAGAARPGIAQDYDLVILNGRVMDPETMLDDVRNVGVKDGTIVAITKAKITGRQTIDAEGLVVAPGFIDTHFHSLDPLTVRLGALDGVTSGMDMEAGAYNIDQWYASKKGKWPLNYGTVICQETCRMLVHDPEVKIEGPQDSTTLFELRAEAGKDGVNGWSESRSNLTQMNQITAHLDEGLRQGALGIGSTIGYMRTGVTTYEMFEAQRAAARYGRLTSVHTRFHANSKTPTEGTLGFAEIFTNAALLKAPLLYAHNNEYGWWEIEEKLQMARGLGMNMWSEYYPYDSGSTSIGSDFFRPDSMKELGITYEECMYDPTLDKFLTEVEYQKIVKEDAGRTVVVFNPARKKWLPYWLKIPHMTVASDAMWNTGSTWDAPLTNFKGHPRTAGTRGKTLALGREHDVPLMFTLSQMSYWPAKHLGDAGVDAMKVRGRLQVGKVADITIFDAESVKDNSTYKAGEQGLPTTGIPYVVVNGQLVVKAGEFQKGVWAGQPIRYPVEQQGRFVPATTEQWLKTFSIDNSGVKPEENTNESDTNKKVGASDFGENPVVSLTALPSTRRLLGSWFGDQPCQSTGCGCEWHVLKARMDALQRQPPPERTNPGEANNPKR